MLLPEGDRVVVEQRAGAAVHLIDIVRMLFLDPCEECAPHAAKLGVEGRDQVGYGTIRDQDPYVSGYARLPIEPISKGVFKRRVFAALLQRARGDSNTQPPDP